MTRFTSPSFARSFVSASLLLLGMAACAPAHEESEAEDSVSMGRSEAALVQSNGIFMPNGLNLPNGFYLGNGITLYNGITFLNGISLLNGFNMSNGVVSGMPARQITPPSGQDLEKWIDYSPTMRKKILRYMVECALPTGVSIKLKYRGVTETIGTGSGNLAPSWQYGEMSTAEQERLTGCLLARVNAKGESVTINLLGQYTGFNSLNSTDTGKFPFREATFYGNIFKSQPEAYVCGIETLMKVNTCQTRACLRPDGSCDCGVIRRAPIFDDGINRLERACFSYGFGASWVPGLCTESYVVDGVTFAKSCTGGGKTWTNVMNTMSKFPKGYRCSTWSECASGACLSNYCQ